MCRIFAFRSVLDSRVHRSLVSAENALAVQSQRHPDGWGVAYYVSGSPHVVRSAGTALTDRLFRRVSGIVTSQTVLAHIRKATQGEVSPLNCHPFQYGRWVMAHNGDIAEFERLREPLTEQVAPRLRRFLLGDTDSEVVFHLFLTHLARRTELDRPGTRVEDVVAALRETVAMIRLLAGDSSTLLSLVVTDGATLVAHRGGKELFYSTHKTRCDERESCPFHGQSCEARSQSGYVNHLIVSSEPLLGENVWTPMVDGELVSIDGHMRFAVWPPAGDEA